MTPLSGRIRMLESLHLFGLDHLDPVILAALADEQPLLLIGPHGTAKSALLNRIAEALGIEHRHYNTSLISFDDLVGYPVPAADRSTLEYVRTPNDLWGAESVFLDEIARCRPEHQNKLFSIILERRVQGIRLEKLRYRWSAMNPPSMDVDGDSEDEAYTGCFPLDVALADRFAYVVSVPAFHRLGIEAQHQVVRSGDRPADGGELDIPALVQETRDLRSRFNEEQEQWLARYVVALANSLQRAKMGISGRRAAVLAGNIRSIHAACQVLREPLSLEEAGLLGLTWGLPQRACGKVPNASKLMGTHRLTLEVVEQNDAKPIQTLLREPDPVKRVANALAFVPGGLNRMEFSQLVSDAYAGLSVPERYLFSRCLLPRVAATDCLTSATYEMLAEPALKLLKVTSGQETRFHPSEDKDGVRTWPRAELWKFKIRDIARTLEERKHPRCVELSNIIKVLFAVERETFDIDAVIAREQEWHELFREAAPDEKAPDEKGSRDQKLSTGRRCR